jgi:phosphoglycolate phosphatase
MELKQVLKEIGVGTLKLPFVVRRVRTEMQKSLEKIRPAADIKTLFGALKEKQYNVGIVTSNSAENTRKFLKQNNIDNVDFVYSSSCLYGKDKLIKNIMGRASINPTQIYFVGDEIRDVEAAHKAHIKSVAVTWGFSDESLLRQSNPDYIIHNPMELINFIGR